jgi:hypothetical protein
MTSFAKVLGSALFALLAIGLPGTANAKAGERTETAASSDTVSNHTAAGIKGNLTVVNRSGRDVYVYVGHGVVVLWDNPIRVNNGDVLTWRVGESSDDPTRIYAVAVDGSGLKWNGPFIDWNVQNFTWTLNP